MKKVYLGLSAIVLSTCAFAQQSVVKREMTPLLPFANNIEEVKGNTSINQQKVGGIVVWSDDFSTPGNWVIDNSGQTAATFGWDIGSTVEAWAFNSPISSTSGGNFAELNNGDATQGTQALNVTYTLTTASSIDVQTLAGTDYVTLNYMQYGARFNDAQEVYVSTDGTSWQLVDDNSDKPVLSGGGGSAYANPTQEVINIQPYITGNPSTVWIRFSWTSAFPTSTDANAWITYGWMIDDVEIVTSPDHDLDLQGIRHSSIGFWAMDLPYYQIPTTQVTAMDFMGVVNNKGAMAQTNTQVTLDINSGAFTSASATGFTSVQGSTDSLYTTSTYTPAATVATYNYTMEAVSDNTDEDPSNNTLTGMFDVTDFIYARDNGTQDGGTYNSGDAYEVGNIFDMFSDDTICSINVTINNSSGGAPLIYGKLYSIDAGTGDFIFMEQSDDYLVTSTDISGQAEVMLPLISPQLLNANESYLVVVGAYGDGGASNDLVTSTAGESEAQTTYYFDGTDQTWYYTTSTPMVRMNFDKDAWIAADVEEFEADFNLRQNVPNPASGTTAIYFDLISAANAKLTISDVSGKVIETMTLGNLPAGSHVKDIDVSNYASGMYYYTLSTDVASRTKKMMIK